MTTKVHTLPVDFHVSHEQSKDGRTSKRYVEVDIKGVGKASFTRFVAEDGKVSYHTRDFDRHYGFETLVAQCLEAE